MDCPREVAEILLNIIRTGLLRIRAFAWSGHPELCASEADHIHNLPDMIADYTVEKLRYYWDVERPAYLEHTSEVQRAGWEPVWQALRPYAENQAEAVSGR